MNNPYKELQPYLESDARIFKGRTIEIEEMYESFDRNEYLVCQADSGEGKSSIIEAGLIPKMKANFYFPIRIVFKSDEHFKNSLVNFDNVICEVLNNEIEKLKKNEDVSVNIVYPKRLTNDEKSELSGWEKQIIDSYAWLRLRYARITIDNLLYTPVLIFDQFEEVFTNPSSQEWTDSFFSWLQELSTDLCPKRIVTELEKYLAEDDFPEICNRKYFKALFSLRSEYVGKLDYWGLQRHYIPLLKNNRYLLRPLTIKGAREVITQQEGYDGLNDVADEIIDILRKLQKGKNYVTSQSSDLPCIPAMFLSIICAKAFDMQPEERSVFISSLSAEKEEDKESAIFTLIEGFYESTIARCGIPSKDMGIIEDVLVNNEGNRQRVSSHADALEEIDFSTKYIEKLQKARLIRVTPEYNRNEDSVEFVHDALCPVVLRKKEQRQALKLEEDRLLSKKDYLRRRKILLLTAASVLLLGVASILIYTTYIVKRRLYKIESKAIAGLAESLTNDGNTYLAQLLLLEVLPHNISNPNRPYVPDAELAFRNAINKDVSVLCEETSQIKATYSQDGKSIIAGNYDGGIDIWDSQTGMRIHSFPGESVYSAMFSPNQKELLVTKGNGGSSDPMFHPKEYHDITIINAANGTVVKTLKGHELEVYKAAYSKDGSTIVSTSWDGTIRTWDANTGKCTHIIRGKESGNDFYRYEFSSIVQLSPDKKKLLSNFGSKEMQIWDVNTETCINTLKGYRSWLSSACFSNNGKQIASAGADSIIMIWDAEKGVCKDTLIGHKETVFSISFSNDDRFLVSTSNDSTVRIWDVERKKCIRTLKRDFVATDASFSPDGKTVLLSSVRDRKVRIWNIQQTPTIKIANDKEGFNHIAFTLNGDYIALADYNGIHLLKMNEMKGYTINYQGANCINFSGDGSLFTTMRSYFDNRSNIQLYDTKTGTLLMTFPTKGITTFGRFLKQIDMSRDGKYLASAEKDSILNIWNTKTGECIRTFRTGQYNSIAVDYNGLCVAAIPSVKSNVICLLNIKDGVVQDTLKSHTGTVNCLHFLPNGNMLSASSDGRIIIWDVHKGEKIGEMACQAGPVNTVVPSFDGKYIIAVCGENVIQVWDKDAKVCLSSFTNEKKDLLNAFLSNDNRNVISVSSDGSIRYWEFPPLQELIDQTRERFKNRQLTEEERRKYYLD